MTTTDTLHHHPNLHQVRRLIDSLEETDLKGCISLVRFGSIPTPNDSILLSKISDTLFRRLLQPINDTYGFRLTIDGRTFFSVSTNPLISSSIISFALARIPSDNYMDMARASSMSKEINVMESSARRSTIDWRAFFRHPASQVCLDLYPEENSWHMYETIYRGFVDFRRRIKHQRMWPYSTLRGVSTPSSKLYWEEIRSDSSFPERLIPADRPVSSRDLVRRWIHTGKWTNGPCELRQRWYAHGLVPRTYFAQGGDAVRVSSYLRDFFNDFADCYLPTERYSRVDANRLETYVGGYFFIYDLTSFTSNFHEQTSFLEAASSFFRTTTVYLVGPNLELQEHTIGELLREYIDTINTRAQCTIHEGLIDVGLDLLTLTHRVAGFLGVPGNLAMCTLPHGLHIGPTVDSTRKQSCAGDDAAIGVQDHEHEKRVQRKARELGILQDEKVSGTRNGAASSYLKRKFEQVGQHAVLQNRVDFPLLAPVFSIHKPDPRFPSLSDDPSSLRVKVAGSTASFIRKLFETTSGEYEFTDVAEYILEFIRIIYKTAGLPEDGRVRRLYGSEVSRIERSIEAPVVFPLSLKYLYRDPDICLAEDLLPWTVEVPVLTDETLNFIPGESWRQNDSRKCRSNAIADKLVVLGFLEKEQSDRMVLRGSHARKYFRRLLLREVKEQEFVYTPTQTLTSEQLHAVGLIEGGEVIRTRKPPRPPIFTNRVYYDYDEPDPAKRWKSTTSFAIRTKV